MSRLAVVDTGTNSTRLLVADVSAGRVREVVRQAVITRLGEGVDRNARLAPGARNRVQECLTRYAAIIGELGAKRALVIATSSMRDAVDGEEFLASMAHVFSFDYRLLTGEEEASLSFSGAAMDLGEDTKAMLFDVGGGSTEVVIGNGSRIDFAASMNLGCVRLRERFFSTDPVSSGEMKDAAEFADGEIVKTGVTRHLRGLEEIVAVAGTVTTLAAIDLGLDAYDRDLVHGHVLTRQGVDKLLKMLAAMNDSQRKMLPVMEEGRADVIVAGTLIVSRLLENTGVNRFTVSEHDILDGVALAMADKRL